MKLYHATYKAYLPSILRHGLGAKDKMQTNWSESYSFNQGLSHDCVYLATDKEVAISFAEIVDEDHISDEVYYSGIVVLEIQLQNLDVSLFQQDPNNSGSVTFLYKSSIASEFLTLMKD